MIAATTMARMNCMLTRLPTRLPTRWPTWLPALVAPFAAFALLATASAQSRTVIRAADAAPPTTPPVAITEPAPSEQLASIQPDPRTRIDQIRQGRRVTEIAVSPGGTSYRYVIENRDPGAQRGPLEGSGSLSVPRFVRFSF